MRRTNASEVGENDVAADTAIAYLWMLAWSADGAMQKYCY